MKREIYKDLKNWKDKSDDIRKPLILEGARQTGKTWIVEEFGKNEFYVKNTKQNTSKTQSKIRQKHKVKLLV